MSFSSRYSADIVRTYISIQGYMSALYPSSVFTSGENGIRNIMEDQYPPIYISVILKSYLSRKRRLADGDTKRKLADTQTDTLT